MIDVGRIVGELGDILQLRQRYEQLAEFLSDQRRRRMTMACGLFAISLIVLLGYACSTFSGAEVPGYVWTYDLASGELDYLATSKLTDQTVRAHVYGCGSCVEEHRFIGYLSRGGEVRAPDGDHWVRRGTEAGSQIAAEAASHCPDQLQLCSP